MALALAKEFTCCSNCDVSYNEEYLYSCTVDGCPKYGEVYCEDCGQSAHKRRDHKFETGWGGNTKRVGVSDVTKGIQGGMNKFNGALGAQAEKEIVGIRQGIVGSMGMVMDTAFKIVDTLNKVQKAASKAAKVASKAGQVATQAGGSGLAGTTTDVFTEIKGIEGAATAAIVMAAFESLYHTVRFVNGDIETWSEFGYHLSQGWVAAIGLYGGNIIGGAIGAAAGTCIGGPLGAVIGKILGGIAGGLIGAKLTRSGFDKLFGDAFGADKEQAKRATLIKDALNLFGYAGGADDLNNENIFNEKELKKRYKNLCKTYHPDKGGSAESFYTVTASFGVLISLVKKSDKSDAIKQVKKIQQAIAWH